MQWKYAKQTNSEVSVVLTGVISPVAKHAELCAGVVSVYSVCSFPVYLLPICSPRKWVVIVATVIKFILL
jgi:hypothetical protein